jgi:hypothetical protein
MRRGSIMTAWHPPKPVNGSACSSDFEGVVSVPSPKPRTSSSCVLTTPLGRPVVPEVLMMSQGAVGSRDSWGGSEAGSRGNDATVHEPASRRSAICSGWSVIAQRAEISSAYCATSWDRSRVLSGAQMPPARRTAMYETANSTACRFVIGNSTRSPGATPAAASPPPTSSTSRSQSAKVRRRVVSSCATWPGLFRDRTRRASGTFRIIASIALVPRAPSRYAGSGPWLR